jgi:hypothetical protein
MGHGRGPDVHHTVEIEQEGVEPLDEVTPVRGRVIGHSEIGPWRGKPLSLRARSVALTWVSATE